MAGAGKNNSVTYDQLECPSPLLECILTDLFRKFQKKAEQVIIRKNETSIIFKQGDEETVINIADMVNDNNLQEVSLNGSVVTFVLSDSSEIELDFADVVTNGQTITSINSTANLISYFDEENQETGINIIKTLAFTIGSGVLKININGVEATVNLENIVAEYETNTLITNTITGHVIATYLNEQGAIQDIKESITNFEIDSSSDHYNLIYNKEDATQQTLPIPLGIVKVYTNATTPATGVAGQIIFVSDGVGTDASVGVYKAWQPSINNWKNLY